MVKNADKYYFPIKESIQSILPIVDEFIVALGASDSDDQTLEKINSIGSPKIKIYHRKWDEKDFVDGRIFKNETNFALSKCSGDWCFYLQADEVAHEKDLDHIVKICQDNLTDETVDGLLFKYYHFWGDYDHYLPYHGWYKNEIRLVKNNRDIVSIKDAISFRKKDNQKLVVKPLDAHIYHYGWVRPPAIMQSKKKEQDGMFWGRAKAKEVYHTQASIFDYGALGKIAQFKDSHPKVMQQYINEIFWKDQLNYTNQDNSNHRKKHKHEQLKNRLLSSIENNLLGGKELFGYSNWILKK